VAQIRRGYFKMPNVMNRVLFRQMGGPAQPMPQDMMPPAPAPAPAMEQQVQGAESMGQEIGAKKAAEMIGTIDAAEDYQTLIDGIRGNSMPLEARYQELAGLVGEQDAMSTPESVLALTQPTIMMTEQGAMDSGIGELMQGISGSVDMEGPMEEGVGSLMAAGAGNTPPANFRNGGPVEVRKFGDGGAAEVGDVSPYFKSAMQARSNILGTPEERAASLQDDRDMAQAQMLFDIAGTALNFAGNTQGGSIAERLANAAAQTQLTDKIGARTAGILQAKKGQKSQDQQLALSALESAEKRMEADRVRAGQTSLANLKAANDLTTLLSQQSFTKGENESDREHRLSIANANIAAQKVLQTSGAENTLAEIAARGEIQKALQVSQNEFTKLLQDDKFDFTRQQDSTGRAHAVFLQGRAAENAQKLEALRFDNSLESLALQDQYRKENVRIEAEISLDNRLQEMGAANGYDIAKAAKGQEYAMALQSSANGFATVRQEDQQAHDLAKQALANAAAEKSQLTAIGAQRALQTLSQNFQGTEAEKARAFEKAYKMIDNAFKIEELSISQGKLELGQAQLAVDAAYKQGQLAVAEAEANAVKIGSDSLTNQIQYITDEARLNSYANGSMENPAEFETAVLNYLAAAPVFNSSLGVNEPIAAELPASVLNKIRTGNPDFYKKIVPVEPPRESTYFNPEGETSGDKVLFLRDAKKEILNPNGSVAFDSPVWANATTDIYNPEIDYTQAIGFSRVVPGFQKGVAEGFAELRGGLPAGRTPAEAKNLTEASATLDSFATALLQFKTDVSDDRVLKFVQEKIEETVKDIRSGGFLLKTDADARATLKALKNDFSQSLRASAMLLPEYGGSAPMTASQTLKETTRMNKLKLILNEIIKFEEGFADPPKIPGVGGNDIPVTDGSVAATQDFLESLVRKGGSNNVGE
jgi:hypothetical protein